MHAFKFIRENPITVLGVAVLALIGWVAIDLANTGPRKPSAELPPPPDDLPLIGPAAVSAIVSGNDAPNPTGNSVVSSNLLPHLKAGMKRVEVEQVLGPPTPDRIQPVSLSNGRVTYSIAYELDDIGPPMTIKPIHSRLRTLPPPPRPARSLIAFVFDATEPGHPLIDILFSDPLF